MQSQAYVRNIGILASLDAGRTTTSERILSVTSQNPIASGSLALDLARPITQTSAATSCHWGKYRINLVELLPIGRNHDDRVLAVLDGVVLVLDAETGVTTEIIEALRHLNTLKIATAIFVNKLDRVDASLEAIGVALETASVGKPLLLQVPVGGGTGLNGLVDLITLRFVSWQKGSFDSSGQVGPVPEPLSMVARRSRQALCMAVGASVDGDAYALRQAVSESVVTDGAIPVLAGSAFRNRGIEGLLDAIVDYFPAPGTARFNIVKVEGANDTSLSTVDEPFVGFVFDAVDDLGGGRYTFVRIYSGVLQRGGFLLNPISATQERIDRMVRLLANKTEEIDRAEAGDIIALAGLKNTEAGDTLCDPTAPVILKRLSADKAHPKNV